MFPDDRKRVSPYQPSDRRFDRSDLYRLLGLRAGLEAARRPCSTQTHVNYEGVWKLKSAILEKAFAKAGAVAGVRGLHQGGRQGAGRHAAFELRNDPSRARYAMWLQWIADRQLAEAAASGLNSASTAISPSAAPMKAARCGRGPISSRPSVSIGAPPDPFSADGPGLEPAALQSTCPRGRGFAPYTRHPSRANMRHAGVLRIDHVLGLARQFWIPRGASGATAPMWPYRSTTFIAAHRAGEPAREVHGHRRGPRHRARRVCARNSRLANMLSYSVLWFEQDEPSLPPALDYPGSPQPAFLPRSGAL